MARLKSKIRTTLVIGEPNPRQKLFFTANTRFIAYGGARGGGKSWAVRNKAVLLAAKWAGIRILIARRTFPEVRENHILPMLAMLGAAALYKETERTVIFKNGSRIRFGYADGEREMGRFQGQEYDVIFLDEATQFSELQFQMFTACLRGANRYPKRFYLTCNPGGVGHAWVKRLFIDRRYRKNERAEDYTFIPARVTDNLAIVEGDPGYMQMLENLPEELREAWLYGRWDVLAGQYFGEFDFERHVCEPFEIPKGWRRYFAMDYGLDMLAGYWAAFSPEGRCYVYREVYESGLIVSEAAEKILSLEGEDEVFMHLAPGDLWGRSSDTGLSRAESFGNAGLFLTKIESQSRVDGWLALREWLKGDEPRLVIFSCCRNLIRTLPQLQTDTQNPSDCAKEPHELTHAPDALRYLLSGRPLPATETRKKEKRLPWALTAQPKDEEGGMYIW